ncbi:membrane-bound lytic murein transglycosylase B [Natronospira proteinivora]|uniref:Membrane-bound lytic murein transglycosylase B n=1 Tax=Natronospira proteinivora TaxID=1807133 RepID=A0ABT1G7W2_9GAMM|nr:lytic murein transglycosylase B [Natronospira proteinivora]MCP1727380.1 membrane-bound lytic murein transglycosylase B [Natronospira proteinivora]
MKSVLFSTLLFCLSTSMPLAAQTAYHERQDVQAFVNEMVVEHGLDREWLLSVLADVEQRESVLEAIASPAEAMPWYRYRPIFMTDARIQGGVDFWEEHEHTLRRAEETFGVDAAMIVAIIGIETYYGRHQGTHPVLDSLVTLGFDYPPRAAFFRSELGQLFLLADEEDLDIHTLKGSYAGAMGAGQFISSSYRTYAVDFSNSGQRDLFNDWEDAIGSVANYFSEHGWQRGEAVVVPAILPDDLEMEKPAPLTRKKAGSLREAGLVFTQGVDNDKQVLPVRLELEDENAWWVGLNNFWVITRYNHSPLYAMAAWELSRAIEQEKRDRG